MTWQSGGSGGIPGVTSDGKTPGGEVIAGALVAGDLTAASEPSFLAFRGSVAIDDVPGNQVDGDATLYVSQAVDLAGDNGTEVAVFGRFGTLNGHDYTHPLVVVRDNTASAQPLLQVVAAATIQLQVDHDGVQVHGKFKTGASATHTLGAYSGKSVPIYDEAGTLLGYMPLYA